MPIGTIVVLLVVFVVGLYFLQSATLSPLARNVAGFVVLAVALLIMLHMFGLVRGL